MATMFGRFEIQSELSKSDTALIYKALDTETNQVVALKTQSLAPLGDRADAFVSTLIAEGESTRDLVGQNIVLLYGAGEIEGQFCAAMEYIQGNSIATMLARKEGFSIWICWTLRARFAPGWSMLPPRELRTVRSSRPRSWCNGTGWSRSSAMASRT
jgi:serine/threonine protein kinase